MPFNNSNLILTIDDEKSIRKLFKDYLEEFDYQIIEAEDGQQGIEKFDQDKPGLVLVDLIMPKLDGFQVIKHITTNSPNTPIIVISSTDEIDNVIDVVRMGAWDFIVKPIVSLRILKHTIEKAFEKSRLIQDNIEYQKNLEETNRKLKQEMLMAQHIQKRLFPPQNLELGAYLFDYNIFPSMFLSGDFVDYFLIDENNIGFYIADVSGHGVQSALVTVFLRSFIRKYRDEFENNISENILDTDQLLYLLNKELVNDEFDKHLTIVYGILNCQENSLTFTNCGHYPYPILNQNDKSELLMSSNPPVGLFNDQTFYGQKIKLTKSFQLSLFSDGILEILPHKSIKEKTDFLISLIQTSQQRYSNFFNFIERTKNILPDDITILSIKRENENAR